MGTIQAAQFNALQGAISNVLGVGSGEYGNVLSSELYGYGQIVTSTPKTQYTEIRAADWAALRNDMLKCYYHQGLSLPIPTPPTNATEITTADFNLYTDIVSAIGLDINRLAFPADGQYSGTILDAPTKVNWTGTITHTVTLNFGSYTDDNSQLVSAERCARHFFNAGGRIEFTPSMSLNGGLEVYGNTTALDQAWKAIFNRVGSVYLNHSSTSCTNTQYTSGPDQTVSVATNIGFNNLTTSYQTILTSTTASSNIYYPTQMVVKAKVDKSPSPTQITLKITFEDISVHANEIVDSTITSRVGYTRASGSYVSVNGPTAINSSFV